MSRTLKVVFVNVDGPNVMGNEPLLAGIDLPLGLGSLYAYLRVQPDLKGAATCFGRGYAYGRTADDAAADIAKTEADVVAFSAFLWNKPPSMRVAERLKALRPAAFLVFGGPCVPLGGTDLLRFMAENPYLDAVVAGEGEETFAQIVRARRDGRSLAGVLGAAWRDGGQVVVNDPRPPLGSLAGLPSPLLEGLVRIMPPQPRGKLVIPVETSRGCPLECVFCDFHRGQKGFRPFPLERVRAEFDLIEKARFKGVVYVADPCLNADATHFKAVLRACAKLDNLFFNLHGEMFDDESLDLLERVKHFSMALGVQSVNPVAMKRIGRGCNVAKLTRNLARLSRMKNLDLTLDIIVGLPGDDYEGFKRTLDWALAIAPIPILALHHLGVPVDSPLARVAAAEGIAVDAAGFAVHTDGFDRDGFLRASRLCRVIAYFQGSPARREELAQRIARAGRRPSEMLEGIVAEALRTGQMPEEPVGAYSYSWPDSAPLRLSA